MTPSLEDIIGEISKAERPLSNSRLTGLSNLSSPELEQFKQSWQAIETARRRLILTRLTQLAEDNVELNFDGIFKFCLRDSDDLVRSTAIEGLWENEEPSLINPLLTLLDAGNSERVQLAAANALGKFAMLAEHKKLRACYDERIKAALLGVIADKSRSIEVRRRALESAAPFSLPQVRSAIMEAYETGEQCFKISAVYAMGKNCDPYWLPVLRKELGSADAEMRYEAAGACGELEEEEAVPYLVKLVNDPDIDVQLATVQALGKIGGAKAKECLKRQANNAHPAIREAAVAALHELETREAPLFFRL